MCSNSNPGPSTRDGPTENTAARARSWLLCFACASFVRLAVAAEPGIGELTRLDGLPRLRESVEVGAVTSYDRTGGNDDGFSGAYSFVRREGDALVLADLEGPGVITRIWTPTPTDDLLEFYFDGEAAPRVRLPYRKLFDGSTPPFLPPLVDQGGGGNWCYVPMPYAKSCKILLRAPKTQFHQINYATFSAGTASKTFDPAAVARSAELAQTRALFARAGQDVSAWTVPEGTPLHTVQTRRTMAPGETAILFEANKGGRIAGLRLRPASAFAGRDRGLVLQMTWDGAAPPAVLCPAGDFFGFSWGQPAARALLVGTNDDTCYSYFPMPYDSAAKIELRSERTGGPPVEITGEIVYADLPRQPSEGRFNALWRRENPTARGQPFTFVNVEGRGHLVGVTLQAEGEENGQTLFFEGDDRAIIDGRLAVHGTGSEDSFNGGWYNVPGRWETRASYPLSGCLDYRCEISRSGGYRFFLGDAYAFRRSLTVDIEHAPTGNDLPNDYTGVSYLYLAEQPKVPWTLPAVAARAAPDVDRLIYKPGWYQPGATFSLENATLAKRRETIDGHEYRMLSVQVNGPELFDASQHCAFYCDVPTAGRYRVSLETVSGPTQGEVQLLQNSRPAGPRQNARSDTRRVAPARDMGELDLAEGTNRIYFVLSAPDYAPGPFAIDIVTLTLERVTKKDGTAKPH